MRYLILFLALGGLVVSTLALRVHYSTGTEPCSINEKWDCGIVNHSSYAEVAHIPVAAIGIAGYLLLGLLAFGRRHILLALAAVAEKNVLMVWCLYCAISQAIIAMILPLSFGWLVWVQIAAHRKAA
jgi:uncharacterized membrane protein